MLYNAKHWSINKNSITVWASWRAHHKIQQRYPPSTLISKSAYGGNVLTGMDVPKPILKKVDLQKYSQHKSYFNLFSLIALITRLFDFLHEWCVIISCRCMIHIYCIWGLIYLWSVTRHVFPAESTSQSSSIFFRFSKATNILFNKSSFHRVNQVFRLS